MAELLDMVGPRNGSAPLDYLLTEIGTVDLQTAFAVFDGTGASGSFKAALTIRSQSGAIIARVFPSTDLAAGDAAAVTYSPFFRACPPSPSGETFAQAIATLALTKDLRGYWRLGDGASPYADTSGNAGGPVNQVIATHGTAMTAHYTPGALPPAQDDGAVAFNAATTFVQGDNLAAGDARFDFSGLAGWTCALWVYPFLTTTQFHLAAGTYSPGNGGWAIGVGDAAGHAIVLRGDAGSTTGLTGSAIPLNAWTFLVVTYGPVAGNTKIYIDGVLDVQQTTVQALAAFSSIRLGGNGSGGVQYNSFSGGVDEVSVWGEALTAADVTTLATAGGL